jgi:transposase
VRAEARRVAGLTQEQVAERLSSTAGLTSEDALRKELVVQEKDHVQTPGQDKCILASSKCVLAALEKEVGRLKQQLRAHVKTHEKLDHDATLLQSIPGVGEGTAWDVLAEMPQVQELASAQSTAAYAGLSPREQRSGSSARKATHLSSEAVPA